VQGLVRDCLLQLLAQIEVILSSISAPAASPDGAVSADLATFGFEVVRKAAGPLWTQLQASFRDHFNGRRTR